MPDIDVFDPRAYFENKVREMEQEVIAKQARLAICQSNQQRLEQTLSMLESLPAEQVRALQVEIAQLNEARENTVRGIDSLRFEVEQLQAKLAALRAAREQLESVAPAAPTPPSPPAASAGDNVRPRGDQGRTGTA